MDAVFLFPTLSCDRWEEGIAQSNEFYMMCQVLKKEKY